MTVVINGTTGISGVDGSAGTPAVQGSDTNTGVFYPAADTVAVSTSGSERMRIDSAGNVGIGTSSPRSKLSVTNGTENTSGDAPQEAIITGANQAITAGLGILTVQSNTGIAADVGATVALGGRIRSTGTTTDASNFAVIKGAKENATSDNSAGYFAISTKPNGVAPVERMRIDSSGNLLVGKTSTSGTATGVISYGSGAADHGMISVARGSNATMIEFRTTATGNIVGQISQNGTNTTYSTSSDYRLKENIQPMAGALTKIAALKPCTYKWKADGSNGEGFIAHELAEVAPQCVIGKKDAVDAEGNPVYQGIDTSFLVATLTAAIQEQQALITALTTRITALEAK